jgi:hypothetical protein
VPTDERRRQPRQPEALAERRAVDEGDSRAQGLSRPGQVARVVPERSAEMVVGDDAQPEIADRLGDGARALPSFDRPAGLAKETIGERQIPERPPEPPLVPEPLRERAPLVQDLAHPLDLAERQEGVPLLEAQVDELLGALPALGQLPQRGPRLVANASRGAERSSARVPACRPYRTALSHRCPRSA